MNIRRAILITLFAALVVALQPAAGYAQDKSSTRDDSRMKSSSPSKRLAVVPLSRDHKVEFYELTPGTIFVRESGNINSSKPLFTARDMSRKNALELYRMLGPGAGPAPAALIEAVKTQQSQPKRPKANRQKTIEEVRPELDADDINDLREMGVDPSKFLRGGHQQHASRNWAGPSVFSSLAGCPWQSDFQYWMASVGGPMLSGVCTNVSHVRYVKWGIVQAWGAYLAEQGNSYHLFTVKRLVPFYKFTVFTNYGPGGFEVSGISSGCCDFDRFINIVSGAAATWTSPGSLYDYACNYESD